MINNLFSSQIWMCSLSIAKDDKNDILNQIQENYDNNKSYFQPTWNCRVHSTIDDNNNIDYSKVLPYFIAEYQKFSIENNLNSHNFEINELWYNYYVDGSNQEYHTHVGLNTMYSAVFFLRINQDHPSLTFYNPTNYCDYFACNTNVRDLYRTNIIDHSIVYHKYSLDVRENDFIIFPSYLPHGVFVQKTNDPRITISMNFSVIA